MLSARRDHAAITALRQLGLLSHDGRDGPYCTVRRQLRWPALEAHQQRMEDRAQRHRPAGGREAGGGRAQEDEEDEDDEELDRVGTGLLSDVYGEERGASLRSDRAAAVAAEEAAKALAAIAAAEQVRQRGRGGCGWAHQHVGATCYYPAWRQCRGHTHASVVAAASMPAARATR